MTPKDFETVVEYTMAECRRVLLAKNEEYAREGDRLHNFKRAAEKLGCIPEEALLGMMVKHEVSIMDMVEDLWPKAKISPAALREWDEKVIDNINYLILLRGLVIERMT